MRGEDFDGVELLRVPCRDVRLTLRSRLVQRCRVAATCSVEWLGRVLPRLAAIGGRSSDSPVEPGLDAEYRIPCI